MLLFDRQLDKFCCPSDVDQLITVEVLALDAEQDISIVSWHRDHHRRRLAGAEGVFINYDFYTAGSITKFGCGVGGDKDSCLSCNRRQESSAFRRPLTAFPGDAIVAVALGNEIQLSRPLNVCLQCLGEDVVVLIAAKLELPPLLTFGRGWGKRFFAQEAQLFAFHFTASGVEPDFVPVIARDFDRSFSRNGLLIC